MLTLFWGPCTAWQQAVCQCFGGTCGPCLQDHNE